MTDVDKFLATITDLALVVTVALMFTAILGWSSWLAVLIPLPFALLTHVAVSIGAGIYARYRNK